MKTKSKKKKPVHAVRFGCVLPAKIGEKQWPPPDVQTQTCSLKSLNTPQEVKRINRMDHVHVLWNLTAWDERTDSEELTIEVWNGIGELLARVVLTVRKEGGCMAHDVEEKVVRAFASQFWNRGSLFDVRKIDTLD